MKFQLSQLKVFLSIRMEISKRAFINIYQRYLEKKRYPSKRYFILYFFLYLLLACLLQLMACCVSPSQTQIWNTRLFIIAMEHNKRNSKVDSLVSTERKDEIGLDDAIKNAKDSIGLVLIIKEFKGHVHSGRVFRSRGFYTFK